MQWILIIIALLIAAGAGYWMYRVDSKRAVPYPWLTAALRGLVILLVLLLLFAPAITITKNETKKPIVLFLQDNSHSVGLALGNDSAQYREQLNELQDKLNDDYRVVNWGFGKEVVTDSIYRYDQEATDISAALSRAQEFYGTQNLGTVVLASDGRFNQGSNPNYQQLSINAPVYTVGIGDSSRQKDLKVAKVYANKNVSLNSQFEIRADVIADLCRGYNGSIRLTEGNALLATQSINISGDSYDRAVSFTIRANKTGMHHYTISLPAADGEVNTSNNRKDVFIEVTDERKEILIAAYAPHPDVQAIRTALSGLDRYNISVRTRDNLPSDLAKYDILILHQLPKYGTMFLQDVKNSNKPTWYILGSRTEPNAMSQLDKPAAVNVQPGMLTNQQAIYDPSFNAFTLPKEIQSVIDRMPPLAVPQGSIQPIGGAQALFRSKGGALPLWLFRQGKTPTVLTAGEGVWRWRMYEYKNFGTQNTMDECIRQTVSFLTVNTNEKPFRVALAKYIWSDQEPISMNAYLLNANNEQVNDPEVQLTISDSNGNKQDYSFERSGNAYRINIGIRSGGNYSYNAKVTYNGKTYTESGSFLVETMPLELMETGADYPLLYNLAQKYNGGFVPMQQVSSVYDSIKNNARIKPVIQTNIETVPFIDRKWFFFLILIVAAVEWLLRKYWLAQ